MESANTTIKQEKDYFSEILDSMQTHKLIASKTIDTARRLTIQSSQQKKYENTRKLLKNFRDIRWAVLIRVSSIASVQQRKKFEQYSMKQISKLLERYMSSLDTDDLERNDLRLLSEIKALKRPAGLLSLIEEDIDLINNRDAQSVLLARVLRNHYIEDGGPNLPAFLKAERISQPTYYRHLNNAVNLLSVILWERRQENCPP
jgi:hypothetical protein